MVTTALAFALFSAFASMAQGPGLTHFPLGFGAPAKQEKTAPAEATADIPIDASTLEQIHPDVVHNPATGEYFAAWEHQWSGSDYDIRASRVSAAGAPAGVQLTVANSTDTERNPVVAAHASNGYVLVVWERITAGGQHTILARFYNGAGTALGLELTVEADCSFDASVDCTPAVAFNSVRGEYLIVWADETDIDGMSVRGRRLTAAGSFVAAAFPLDLGSAVGHPALAYDATGDRYMVVWHESAVSSPPVYDIAGVCLDGAGAVQGGSIPISAQTNHQYLPDVAFNSIAREYLVVWEDWRAGATTADIYGRRLDWTGSTIGNEFMVSSDVARARHRPAVAFKAAANEYTVVYEHEYSATDFDVYRRRLGPPATPGEEVSIAALGSHEKRPALAAGAGKQYLVLWDDARLAPSTGTDIYATLDASAVFSGKVFNGELSSTAPLPGATVSLYAANDVGAIGTLLATTTAGSTGAWELVAYNCQCDMLNLMESDPAAFVSVGATSTGGTVINSNQIRFYWPLGATVLSGNNFWDKPQAPSDGDPPANWASFSPASWVNVQTVPVSVKVEDTYSGLKPATALYAYSTNGGAAWSAWLAASCTGSDGATTPQTLSATVPFGQDAAVNGQNRVRFRISDVQGNLGESPVYAVAVDTVLPQSASALTCPSHSLSTWSQLDQLTCNWAAGTDAGSGIAGYSHTWDHAAGTTPDAYSEGPALSVTSYALPEWQGWYFHLRTVDKAGNASTALHSGPYWIDRAPPSSQVQSLSSTQWLTTFVVAWSGDPGYGSPIAGYDIRVRDVTAATAARLWLTNTQTANAQFIGVRGHSYAFESRARDAAGNVESWPASPDRQTRVGGDVLVIVWRAPSQPAASVPVYLNGTKAGVTDGAGRLTVPHALLYDELLALRLVYEHPAAKPLHTAGGAINWDWRVYHTSFSFNAAGDPQVHRIGNPDIAQNLTLLPERSLVGFHLVVTVDFDASSAFLTDLAEGLRRASTFFYDAGDGQFFFDTIEIFDNRVRYNEADMHVYASMDVWPQAHRGAIALANRGHIHIPRFFGGDWRTSDGYRVFIHEFGHYGLDLDDEYLDRSGKQPPVWLCATNYATATAADQSVASIMNNQASASEFCSNVDPLHRHETNTLQDVTHGETTWATIVRRFSDSQIPPRWEIFQPEDWGHVVPGPLRMPAPGATSVTIHNADGGACAPFTLRFTTAGATPAVVTGTEVIVDRPSGFDLIQGKTDTAGLVEIYGARSGDVVHAVRLTSVTPLNIYVARHVVACSAGGAVTTVSGGQAAFGMEAIIAPLSGLGVQVTVKATAALAAAPVVELQQSAAAAPIAVPMAFNALTGSYTGQANLVADRSPSGLLRMAARNGAGNELVLYQYFHVHELDANAFASDLFSVDGIFRLVMPAAAVENDLQLAIAEHGAASVQAGLTPVGPVYEIVTDPAVGVLQTPASIHSHSHDQPADPSLG
jgi:hypothetical protein